jgi:N-acetylglucosaminyldiphosphoundecaprenol N-acetyl-beta-D-mannosaminyltransferase
VTQSTSTSSYALLNLVFDSISMVSAKARIRNAARTKESLIFATPNVNFIAMAAKDSQFRQTILRCDLNLVDSRPLYWLAKLIGIPLPEPVAGSSLIESFIEDSPDQSLKVFFFGGQDNAAQLAHEALNNKPCGLISAGYLNPGFGSIESMSEPDIIKQINQAGADFLIVSLGAKKGHAWIEQNKDKLTAPVISHLGAVVNFVSGTQQRSPKFLQKIGMEWLWRIYEEPALYKRYAGDAITLAQACLTSFLPLYFNKLRHAGHPGQIDYELTDNKALIRIIGSLQEPLPPKLLDYLNKANTNPDYELRIDLKDAQYLGSQFVAYLLQLNAKHSKPPSNVMLINIPPKISTLLNYHGLTY